VPQWSLKLDLALETLSQTVGFSADDDHSELAA
jgi:hypothetical protein